jgi:hypothetical protein
MTGCLTGDLSSGAVGTSGGGTAVADDRVASSAGAGRALFTLTNATPAGASADQQTAPAPALGTAAGTGVGANGAGGSGGPLVSGVSSYALVGNASDLSPHVHHEVRITGRLSSATTAYEAADRTPAAQTPGSVATSGPAMRTITVDSIEMVALTCQSR